MDVLTNEDLLWMVEAWKCTIQDRGERYAVEHPCFEGLMTELVERNMMSEEWEWIVDVEELDMEFVRVVIEGQGV